MTLQELFYGTFIPPEGAAIRSHRIGLSGGRHYMPPPPKNAHLDKNGLNATERVVLKELSKKGKTTSSAELSKTLKMTRNHCSIILGELFKKGFVTRYKVQANGTRFFMYRSKEQS